jgi:exportin-5
MQAAIETLQAIYNRTHLHEDEFVELVCPMFTPGSVSLLREVYNWTIADMDVNNIDDQKYMLCKRLSEVRYSPHRSPLLSLTITAG